MSNETTPNDEKNTKLPQIDDTTVEEIPAGELDDVNGGMAPVAFTDCKGSCYGTSVV